MMIRKINESFDNQNRLCILLTVIISLFVLAGCATGGNFGKTERNRDLDNMFLNYVVLPDHRYYTTGGFDAPDAIMAIHRDYELDNTKTHWRVIPNVDYAQMRKWIDTIAPEQNYRGTNSYFAAYILNPDGKRIGAWYSIDPHATVRFLEENKIVVHTPTPELNRRGIRRGRR